MATPLFSRISAELRRFPRPVLPIVTPITVALADGADAGVSSATQADRAEKSNGPAPEASQQLDRGSYSQPALENIDADDAETRIDSDEQWERVTKVLDATILGAEKAEWAHLSAQDQLDAGDYEFASLVDDLQGLVSGLADVVSVHTSETLEDEVSVGDSAAIDEDAEQHLRPVEGDAFANRGSKPVVPSKQSAVAAKKSVAA